MFQLEGKLIVVHESHELRSLVTLKVPYHTHFQNLIFHPGLTVGQPYMINYPKNSIDHMKTAYLVPCLQLPTKMLGFSFLLKLMLFLHFPQVWKGTKTRLSHREEPLGVVTWERYQCRFVRADTSWLALKVLPFSENLSKISSDCIKSGK